MGFNSELEFEKAFIEALKNKGWNKNVIYNPTEEDLINNWMNILFENNCDKDHLNNVPLSQYEIKQILDKVEELKSPMALNGFINGKTVTITRDENSADIEHRNKEISLKIYDRQEIAGGTSRYQIVEQPQFEKKKAVLPNRRGDVMLLINGMPVIHIELKRSGVPVSEACHQIEKYSHEGIYTGLYSLVQVFVAMNPEESLYFANPGKDQFNSSYFFHWADFNNEPINDWRDVTENLLSIPPAHQLIGFYTVADKTDNTLKVLRSYQIYAAREIAKKVYETDWNSKHEMGGYIFATTGSGKSLTSFKSAQLISTSKDADKVVFLLDRVELGTQSLDNYRNFATPLEEIQETEDTNVLINKLKSTDASDTLIVTSIQKMSRIKADGLSTSDLEKINKKKMVVIVDECHRDTFGEMLRSIKDTFTNALYFGFTGTPILMENKKKGCTTSDIFGNELHRYSIADGIRDKNVLGFDVTPIHTFKDNDIREKVALDKAKAASVQEALSDPQKKNVYYDWYNRPMIELENELPKSQYHTLEHRQAIIEDIKDNWLNLSRDTFHALFATSSIKEAIEYYRLFKKEAPEIKVTALFDKNIDENADWSSFKEDGLVEIVEDYNQRYHKEFGIFDSGFKKDISNRLAHKKQYKNIKKEDEIDILIVVDQMLTGYDSKWINTLYLDKTIKNEQIIQAFSRTNRLFGDDKPFGIIKYYRRPYLMEERIKEAVKLYSGERAFDIFVDKLPKNIEAINLAFAEIKNIFTGIPDFSRLPEDPEDIAKFVLTFNRLNNHLTAALIQGLKWNDERLELSEETYWILVQRYKEIEKGGGGEGFDLPYDLKKHITTATSVKIDTDYMNNNFKKYLRLLEIQNVSEDELQKALDDLHSSFAVLTQDEQKVANDILVEVQAGTLVIDAETTIRDVITDRLNKTKTGFIRKLHDVFNVDDQLVLNILNFKANESNLNEFGRFDEIVATADEQMVKDYFIKTEGTDPGWRWQQKIRKLLKDFILNDGFDIENNKQ